MSSVSASKSMLDAFWKGWGAAESLSFLQTEIAVVAESPKCSHLSLGGGPGVANLPSPPAASQCFPMPDSYETPTTYHAAVSWEEGKFQDWCGREQDGACSWVPGQPFWLISSCDWGLGVALKWGSLALASLAVFHCWSLFWEDGSSPMDGCGMLGVQQEGQTGTGRSKSSPSSSVPCEYAALRAV